MVSWTSSVCGDAMSKSCFSLTVNPLAVTRMAYLPGCTVTNEYCPLPSVVAVCSGPEPRSCTWAPGTDAPEGSVTAPRRIAGGLCACRVNATVYTISVQIDVVFILQ